MALQSPNQAISLRSIGPIAGILFVISLVVSIPLAPGPSNNTVASVNSEFLKHHNRILVGQDIGALAIIFFPIFLIWLWSSFRSRDNASGWLGGLAVITGLGGLILETANGAVNIALATGSVLFHSGITPDVLFATYKVGAIFATTAGLFLGMFSLAAAGLFLLSPGVRWRWLGWIALVAGILFLITGFSAEDEMFSGIGFGGFLGLILWLLWILIYSIGAVLGKAGPTIEEASGNPGPSTW